MKRSEANLANLTIVVLLLSVVAISCTRVKQMISGGTQTEKTRRFNSQLPGGFASAEQDPNIGKEGTLLFLISDDGQIYLRDPNSQPVDLVAVEMSLGASSGKPGGRPVYVAVGAGADVKVLQGLFEVLRKNDFDDVRLLVKSVANDFENPKTAGDVAGPDRAFPVQLRATQLESERPNPLVLMVSFRSNEKYSLNQTDIEDGRALETKLAEIFRLREANGVFREGSNEVEKTVILELGDADDESSTQRYGYVIRAIDSIKKAGASPIVLADPLDLPTITLDRDQMRVPPGNEPSPTRPGITVSGGVLNGKAISLPKPNYPPAARAVRASGSVNVQVTVDEKGSVTSASAVSGHPLLRAAAVKAAQEARFSPTVLQGKPVKVTGVIVYNFSPDGPGL
jgi:TonB family protein